MHAKWKFYLPKYHLELLLWKLFVYVFVAPYLNRNETIHIAEHGNGSIELKSFSSEWDSIQFATIDFHGTVDYNFPRGKKDFSSHVKCYWSGLISKMICLTMQLKKNC